MKEIPVHKIREHLTKYLSEAAKGEEIVITKHAKPLARLMGYENEKSAFPDLTEFRNSVEIEGSVLETLLEMRGGARY
jgi:prevent-host-death family protein